MTWEIQLEAGNPVEAAREALAIQRDPSSLATCFSVVDAGSGELSKVDADLEDAPDGEPDDQNKEEHQDDSP